MFCRQNSVKFYNTFHMFNQQNSFILTAHYNFQQLTNSHKTQSSPGVNQGPVCSSYYSPYVQPAQNVRLPNQHQLSSSPSSLQDASPTWPSDVRHHLSRWSSPSHFEPMSYVTNVDLPIFLPKNFQNYPPPMNTNW